MSKKPKLRDNGYPTEKIGRANGYTHFAYLPQSRKISTSRVVSRLASLQFLPLPVDSRELLTDDTASYLAEYVHVIRCTAGDTIADELLDLCADLRDKVADNLGVDRMTLPSIRIRELPRRVTSVSIGSSNAPGISFGR